MNWKIMIMIGVMMMTLGCITELDDADDYLEQTSFAQISAQHTTITIASQDVYTPVTDLNADYLRGFTYSDGNLFATYDGNYDISGAWSFDGGANNEYHITVFHNGVNQLPCHTERVIGSGADVGAAPIECILSLSAGDRLTAMIENASGTTNTEAHSLTLKVLRISN